MSCFFIGPKERTIFVNLTEPRRDSADAVVLLCYPFGQEYMRAHRAYRQLATLLGRAGYHVLRFDYPSTGDSYGNEPLESFDVLVEELGQVVDEAKKSAGKSVVYACGLRFGALVAAKLAQRNDSIKKLFLWDSYSSGGDFNRDCLNQLADEVPDEVRDDAMWRIHGFPLAKSFRMELEQFDLCDEKFAKIDQLHHVISHESPASIALKQTFKGKLVEHLVVSNGDWNFVDTEGSILMPTELIKKLCLVISSPA